MREDGFKMRHVEIGPRVVGDGTPAFLVAEVGINHQGSVDLARRLIDMAMEAGVDAVKFQKRSVRRMLTRAGYEAAYDGGRSFGPTYGTHREALEFTEKQFRALQHHAKERGVLFFASVWDEESADLMERMEAPVFKLGSPDLTNNRLVRHVARKGKPVILSTGMSTMTEVEHAVRTVLEEHAQLILLHCTSIYPSPYGELNLKLIPFYRKYFGLPVGYSGHEEGVEAAIAARALGACVIEKHITLDRSLRGSDHAFSLEFPKLKDLVRQVRNVELALSGRGKTLLEAEIPFRRKLAKSLVTVRPIAAGEVLSSDMLVAKSPGIGIFPDRLHEVLGRSVTRDVDADVTLLESDLN